MQAWNMLLPVNAIGKMLCLHDNMDITATENEKGMIEQFNQDDGDKPLRFFARAGCPCALFPSFLPTAGGNK